MMRKSMAVALLAIASLLISALPASAQAAQGTTNAQNLAGKTDEPNPEASAQDIDGPTMFATLCGFCHQNGGRDGGRGPKLANNPHPDEYLIERIKKGKPGAMPAFGKVFTGGQIIAILAYIRGLDE